MRNRKYLRQMRAKHIKRKRRISKSYWHVKCLGQLNKGKIHCSCYMCTSKTRRDGPPISELKRLYAMRDEVGEYLGDSHKRKFAHALRIHSAAVA